MEVGAIGVEPLSLESVVGVTLLRLHSPVDVLAIHQIASLILLVLVLLENVVQQRRLQTRVNTGRLRREIQGSLVYVQVLVYHVLVNIGHQLILQGEVLRRLQVIHAADLQGHLVQVVPLVDLGQVDLLVAQVHEEHRHQVLLPLAQLLQRHVHRAVLPLGQVHRTLLLLTLCYDR